jgi:hypothetical protein
MPKINTPEVSKGFWLTVGVIFALFLLSVVTALWARAKSTRKT